VFSKKTKNAEIIFTIGETKIATKINIESATEKADLNGDKNNPNKDINHISLIVKASDKIKKDLGIVIQDLNPSVEVRYL